MDFENEVAGLSEELKAKLAGCETSEELLALAKEEGYELSDEALQNIAGGGFWGGDCDTYCDDCPNDYCFDRGRNIGE